MSFVPMVVVIVCSVVLVVWLVAERMFLGEVARIWRNPELPRRDKAQAVATAVADILFVCLPILFVWLPNLVFYGDGNGYCFDFSKCPESDIILVFLCFVIGLAIAPILAIFVGAFLYVIIFYYVILAVEMQGIVAIALLFSSIYFLAWASVRGKIMRHMPGSSKRRAAFVFFVTYWPLGLMLFFLFFIDTSRQLT